MATLGELSGWRKLTPEEIRHVYPVLKKIAKGDKQTKIVMNIVCAFAGIASIRGAIWCLQNLFFPPQGIDMDLGTVVILVAASLACVAFGIFAVGIIIRSFASKHSYKEALEKKDWVAMDVTFQSVGDYDTPWPYGYIRDVNGNMLEGVIGRGKRIPASIPSDAYFKGPGLYVRVPKDLSKECIVQFVFDKKNTSANNG